MDMLKVTLMPASLAPRATFSSRRDRLSARFESLSPSFFDNRADKFNRYAAPKMAHNSSGRSPESHLRADRRRRLDLKRGPGSSKIGNDGEEFLAVFRSHRRTASVGRYPLEAAIIRLPLPVRRQPSDLLLELFPLQYRGRQPGGEACAEVARDRSLEPPQLANIRDDTISDLAALDAQKGYSAWREVERPAGIIQAISEIVASGQTQCDTDVSTPIVEINIEQGA